ncbi:phage tail protein [Shewanella subflava]|uniref:Phage tail protein n=1 Tax=Shewanella subflava TaxID=2986476 RepID=A0ABT3I5A2_9GAMM|nr:phage tail protein [Shewanella subflava]MCW3171220.1 phage tail protein [Shewanella subflava]
MTVLNDLTMHLYESLKPAIKLNDIDAWQDNGQLHIIQDDQGKGILIAKWQHSAVIAIERLPHRHINPYTVLAILAAWLSDNEWPQEEYGLTEPSIDIDVISHDHAQMFISLELVEDLEIEEDEQGPIQYLGKKFKLTNIVTDWAEEVQVENKRS